jgi:hypothetical protein
MKRKNGLLKNLTFVFLKKFWHYKIAKEINLVLYEQI